MIVCLIGVSLKCDEFTLNGFICKVELKIQKLI